MSMICPGQAFTTFYALEWVSTVSELWQGPCGQRRYDKFIVEKEEFEEKFARLLYDYLVISCIGEARHAGTSKVVLKYKDQSNLTMEGLSFKLQTPRIRVKFPSSRNKSFTLLPIFSADTWLKTCQRIFLLKFWGSAFGGIKWANIARAALRYNSFSPKVFIDHIADIQHNGGTAFNKEYEGLISYPGQDRLKELLNAKASEAGIRKYLLSSMRPYSEKYEVYNRFRNYIIPALERTATPEEKDTIITKKWNYNNIFTLTPKWPEKLSWGDDGEKVIKIISDYTAYTQKEFEEKMSKLYLSKYGGTCDDEDDEEEEDCVSSSNYPCFNRRRIPRGMIHNTTKIKGLEHLYDLALVKEFTIMLRVGTEGLV